MILRELNARETGTRQIHERGSAILVSTQLISFKCQLYISSLSSLVWRFEKKGNTHQWSGQATKMNT